VVRTYRVFLKPKVLNNTFNTACADLDFALAHSLSDHLWRGIGIEEAMADDLADVFLRSSVVTFGSAFLIL